VNGTPGIFAACAGGAIGREIYRGWIARKAAMNPEQRRRAGRWEALFWVVSLTPPGLVIAFAISTNFY